MIYTPVPVGIIVENGRLVGVVYEVRYVTPDELMLWEFGIAIEIANLGIEV
ncbi:MAG: hypothetical protein SFT92_08815 [Rickettsiales bacterium]|nr:hypothetical protein [Rickettsiales bacterium]